MSDHLVSCRSAALLLALTAFPAAAAEPNLYPPSLEPRVVAGKSASPAGALLSRERGSKAWDAAAAKESVFSRDLLLALPGVQGVVETPGVTLKLWGNLPQQSGFAGLESEVVLHDSRTFDLDLTLLTGRVVLTNTQKKGPAHVWVRLPTEAWQLTLNEPGDEAALELFGGWPHGVKFHKEARPDEGPTSVVELLVLKGRVDLTTTDVEYSLGAANGPMVFDWNSAAGAEGRPHHLKDLPSWADPKAAPPTAARAMEAVVEAYQKQVHAGYSPSDALEGLFGLADKEGDKDRAALMQKFAVFGLSATDHPSVVEHLADSHSAAIRGAAILAVRHWIGKGPGRDQLLYQYLTDRLDYTEGQAEAVMQLLHSPFDADQRETYEALIKSLGSRKLAIRELARWHLYRMAPAAQDIPFDAAAPEEERDKAVQAWRKLLADGDLPPRGKKEK